MKKLWIAIATLACFTLGAQQASASTIIGARITEIVPNNVGIVRIYIDTARTGLPSCAGTTTTTFDINATTMAGQAMLSGLYLAFASNLPIDFGGTGACDVETGVESIGYFGVRRS